MVIEHQCGSFMWTMVQPWWEAPSKSRAAYPTPTPSPTPTEASTATQRACPHTRTTKKGTNGQVDREVCRDCGRVLRNHRKDSASRSDASTPATHTETEADMEKEYEAFGRWYQNKGKK